MKKIKDLFKIKRVSRGFFIRSLMILFAFPTLLISGPLIIFGVLRKGISEKNYHFLLTAMLSNLFLVLVPIILGGVTDSVIGLTLVYFYIVIYSVIFLFTLVRLFLGRLEDYEISKWWGLLLLVPFFNLLFLLIVSVYKGDISANKYGEYPNDVGNFKKVFLNMFIKYE